MAKRHKDLKIPHGVSPGQDFVQILDPATGTGTFLVEVIELVHNTLVAKWRTQGHGENKIDALWNEYVPKHLLTRLHGYELLMAPYAIAHLKVGLKLYETGYRFDSDQRARVYLTNALEPATDLGQMKLEGLLPALAHEAQAVNAIKGSQRFTALIGNPPYSEKSKNDGAWISELMERYKATIRSEEAQIKSVSNDYVKFLCFIQYMASLCVKSIIGVITSNGYLDGRLFRDLRKSWLTSFGGVDIVNLHGSGRRGDAASDDENVFDILQGVCIAIARRSFSERSAQVRYFDLLGSRLSKYKRLSQGSVGEGILLGPSTPLFLFAPSSTAQFSLRTWPLSAIFGSDDPRRDRNRTYAGGFKTRQDRFTVGFDERTLRMRIAEMADATVPESRLREKYRLCSTTHFEFQRARGAAQSGTLGRSIRSVRYRPFDDRLMIWAREVLCEPQDKVTRHLLRPNLCLTTSRVVKDDAFRHVSITRGPVEVISLSSSTSTNAYMFPLYRYASDGLLGTKGKERRLLNLSPRFISELEAATGLVISGEASKGVDPASMYPEEILGYVYALLHSSSYRLTFADDLLRDFPGIPIPSGREYFRALAAIGGELVALHLLESPHIEKPITEFIGGRNPEVEKISWSHDAVWLDKAQSAGFRGVCEDVWNFHIGGYQVCEKWLKDRKGRTLSKDDISHYQKIVVALSETIRLMAEIEEVIEAHGGWPDAFQLVAGPAEKRPALLMAAESPPPYVVGKAKPQPVYTRSLPDIARTLRSNRIALPRNRRFTDLDREGKSCAIWCVLHGEGSLAQDDDAVKLCATRLRQSGWADYQRLDPRSDLYQDIDETLKRATRQGNGWLDKPANLHVRAYRRFSEMQDEQWRDCVVKVLSRNDGSAERHVVVRDAFDEARGRFGIEREKLVRSVEAPVRSAINSCIRRGYIRREGPERLVLLARYDDPS